MNTLILLIALTVTMAGGSILDAALKNVGADTSQTSQQQQIVDGDGPGAGGGYGK